MFAFSGCVGSGSIVTRASVPADRGGARRERGGMRSLGDRSVHGCGGGSIGPRAVDGRRRRPRGRVRTGGRPRAAVRGHPYAVAKFKEARERERARAARWPQTDGRVDTREAMTVLVRSFSDARAGGRGRALGRRRVCEVGAAEGHPLGMGGVWHQLTTGDDELVESVAIFTCPPKAPVTENPQPLAAHPPAGGLRALDRHGCRRDRPADPEHDDARNRPGEHARELAGER